MVQTSAATTRFTMLQGMDSLCTVTWKQNLGRPGHLSCLGASKTSYSRTLGTFQMSKIKVKLCDNRCYCTPPSLYAYLTSQCHSQTRIGKNGHRPRILLSSFFLAKTFYISLIIALKNRKGKEKIKQNRHCYLYVG